jgi:predicted flap endonuclease-1-like 5' DNA nuclease
MGNILCWIWPYLLGGLLGWLAAGWLARAALARKPATVEKIVDRPVDRIVEKVVEKPVDRIVEKVVEKPVDRVVEKVVEKIVDNPSHLAQIASLTAAAALVPSLKSQLSAAQAAPAQVVEKVVEKIVEKPVDRVVEKIVEKTVVDTAGIEARDRELADLRRRLGAVQADFDRMKAGPDINMEAARAAGFALKKPDDLEIIEGIGPKIAELFYAAGVNRFWQLAHMTPAQIQPILDAGGANFKLAVPDTWPEQSALAANNHWRALKSLQDVLIAGIRK